MFAFMFSQIRFPSSLKATFKGWMDIMNAAVDSRGVSLSSYSNSKCQCVDGGWL